MTIDVFTPLHLNPVLFTDPKDSANLVLSGSDITQMTNLVGGVNHFEQADTGDAPHWDATTKLADFLLSHDMTTAQDIELSDCTIMSVYRNSGNYGNFVWRHGTGTDYRGIAAADGSGYRLPNIAFRKAGGSVGDDGASDPTPVALSAHITSFVADRGTHHIDGELTVDVTDSRIEQDIDAPIIISTGSTSGSAVFIEQGAFAAFDHALNAWQREALEGWAAHHHAISSQLIDGHLYKSQPPMRVVGPNATISGGGAIDIVRIFNWPDGALHLAIAPEANGDWWVTVPAGMQFGITYIAAGCAPITHGPYNAPIP